MGAVTTAEFWKGIGAVTTAEFRKGIGAVTTAEFRKGMGAVPTAEFQKGIGAVTTAEFQRGGWDTWDLLLYGYKMYICRAILRLMFLSMQHVKPQTMGKLKGQQKHYRHCTCKMFTLIFTVLLFTLDMHVTSKKCNS